MKQITGKLGTHSTNIYQVRGNKSFKAGDKIWIRSRRPGTDNRVYNWSHVTVDEVFPDGSYVKMSLI